MRTAGWLGALASAMISTPQLEVAAARAQSDSARVTSVKFSGTNDGLGFRLAATVEFDASKVTVKTGRNPADLRIVVADITAQSAGLEVLDRQVKDVFVRAGRTRVGTVIEATLNAPITPKMIEAATVKAKGRKLAVRLPRNDEVADRWLEKKKKEEEKKKASGVDPEKEKKRQAEIDRAKKQARKTHVGQDTKPFIEGELASVGMIGLLPWENRFGLLIGVERLGETFYGTATPGINYTTPVYGSPLSMSFGVPLRFEILDANADERFADAGRFRSEDWDEPSDYSQVIRSLTYGGKEKHFYLDVSAFKSGTVGHGTIMKRYNPHLNLNTHRVSGQFDAFSDYGGFETYINDITGPNVVGGLVFFKPLSLVNRDNFMMRSFSIGGVIAADLDAPVRNQLDFNDIDDDGFREVEQTIDQDTFQPIYLDSEVVAYGVSSELKLVDKRILDWKLYVDYSWLESGLPRNRELLRVERDAIDFEAIRSSGFTFGNLIRMNWGSKLISAFRARVEYRNYEANYLPSYFDSLYEIQRVTYRVGPDPDSGSIANSTKLLQVLGRDPNGPRINGGYLELNWRLSHFIALAAGFEVNDTTPDDHMFLHVEVPHIGRWQFLAAYHRRNASDFADLFAWGGDNDIFVVKTRYGVADWFHLNLDVMTPFEIGKQNRFDNTVQANFGVEMGFSF